MTTPNIFVVIKEFLANNMLGSIVLFVLFIIFVLIVLILAARVSFKVGLILVFPAILAFFGIGISEGLLGVNFKWIPVLVIVAIAIGAYAFIWFKLSE